MDSVIISQKYQIVIPVKIRKMLGVKPGQKMRVIAYDNQVVLIPVRPVIEARGSLKGIDTEVVREEQDRV
jgi:AbrB family looped-hinge helix DNA binding protein